MKQALGAFAHWAAAPVVFPIVQQARQGRQFEHGDRRFDYFLHRYNSTWRNERTIEVPLAWDLIQRAKGKRILEVGNVMSHYFDYEHDTLDKYEAAPGVMNQDVVEFKPTAPYDLIVSISTLEHVGWDETPRDPNKIPAAVAAMTSWLAPGGLLFVTLPVGYNPVLDAHLAAGRVRFQEQFYFTRTTGDNQWRGAAWDDLIGAKYGVPFEGSCHMLFGINRAAE